MEIIPLVQNLVAGGVMREEHVRCDEEDESSVHSVLMCSVIFPIGELSCFARLVETFSKNYLNGLLLQSHSCPFKQ